MQLARKGKSSVFGYFRTRRIILHPLFLTSYSSLSQLCLAIWSPYKGAAEEHYRINHLFFEFAVDLVTTVFLTFAVFTKANVRVREVFRMPRKAWMGVAYSGLVGFCGSQVIMTRSVFTYQPLYLMLTPTVAALLALLLGIEKKRTFKTVGITVSMLGTVVMIVISHFFFEDVPLWPSLIMIINVIAIAFQFVILRVLFKDFHLAPTRVTWLGFLIATPGVFIAMLCEMQIYPGKFPSLEDSLSAIPDMLGLLYTIALAYTVGNTVMAWSVRHSAITIVSIYVSARPCFGALVGIILNRDVGSFFQGACVALTFSGLLIVNAGKRWEKHKVANEEVIRRAETIAKVFAMEEVQDRLIN